MVQVMEHNCDNGWICEKHPEESWPHPIVLLVAKEGRSTEDCPGPGMSCRYPGCEMSLAWFEYRGDK